MAAYPAFRKARGLPPELINIGGTAAALLAVVAVGAGLSHLVPQTVWFTAASYGAPAVVAFAAYAWIAHRFR
ncbi:MAG TPA: hypothetical protein VMT68_04075 [Caulobacteraceae bacterium]|nr:hypothetical protein [Caulobacteraceae bacterium]